MERFFRSLKNEWVPVTGYVSFSDAAHEITDYIVGYYSALSRINITAGYPPTNRKIDTGKTLKWWPVFVDHYKWKGLILPLIKHIDIILASPSLATDDCTEELSRMFGNPEELKSYADVLLALASSLPAYRQELFRRIANDYRALTHPAPLNIWTLSENAGNAIRKFFRRPPTF
jgi:hypothetical protein